MRAILRLTAIVLALCAARSSLADHYRIPTGSMEPTVDVGDRIVVNKAAYGLRVPFTNEFVAQWSGPEVGDVVVLDSPEDGKTLLKRVVGVPGARVEVRGGRVTIDGTPAAIERTAVGLFERIGDKVHRVRLTNGGGPDFGPIVIPNGHYLVMGDNRGDSRDGRTFGLVDRDAILGRAIAVYWHDGPSWRGL